MTEHRYGRVGLGVWHLWYEPLFDFPAGLRALTLCGHSFQAECVEWREGRAPTAHVCAQCQEEAKNED